MERDNTRMKYFLASLSQSQMACDSGLFHSCNTASNKDGRTVLFLVINWVFVGVKILPALTSRQVLTQRRGKEGREYAGPSILISLVSSRGLLRRQGRENNLPRRSEALTPENKRCLSHRLWWSQSSRRWEPAGAVRAGGSVQWLGPGYVGWRPVSGSGRGGTELRAVSSFSSSFLIPTQNKIRPFCWLIMHF